MKTFILFFYKFLSKKAFKIGQLKAELELESEYQFFYREKRNGYWKKKLKKFGNGSHIYPNVIIHVPNMVSMGDKVNIAEFVHMWGGGGIEIGNNVIIASHTVITSQTHDKEAKIFRESSIMKPIKIRDNCWIGAGAIIFPGIEIGEGSIIAAQSVVTKNVPPHSIIAGVPGQVVETIKNH